MKVIIFGVQQLSELAYYCLTHDSPDEVVAFTVNQDFINNDKLYGLPVVPFETLEEIYPPDQYRMLIPLGSRDANKFRADRYHQAKEKGYQFISYVSTKAHIWPDLSMGENCMIYEGAIVQPFAKIGDNVIIRSGSHISHHCKIGDHCFIAARAALAGAVTIGGYSFIGVNATIRDDINIAKGNFIGAGSVVVKNTEEDSLYMGVPAKRIKENK